MPTLWSRGKVMDCPQMERAKVKRVHVLWHTMQTVAGLVLFCVLFAGLFFSCEIIDRDSTLTVKLHFR
jgi:hypothetical protein